MPHELLWMLWFDEKSISTLHIMYLICTVVYHNKLIVVLFQTRKHFSCFFKANMMTHRVLFRDICHNFFWGDITYMCGAKYDPIFLKMKYQSFWAINQQIESFLWLPHLKKNLVLLHKKYTVWLCDFNVVTQKSNFVILCELWP